MKAIGQPVITRPKVPGPPAESENASYVVVTPEPLADHDLGGAALAEWTKYKVPTPEMVMGRVGATCYTAHQFPNLGKGAFLCVTPFSVAS